jgi:hypothetical protein
MDVKIRVCVFRILCFPEVSFANENIFSPEKVRKDLYNTCYFIFTSVATIMGRALTIKINLGLKIFYL